MNVWRKTCTATSAVGWHELAVRDDADRRSEDTDTGVVVREVSEQSLPLGRPDRVGERLALADIARLQRGQQDLRAVIGLGAVQFGLLVVRGLVGLGELL